MRLEGEVLLFFLLLVVGLGFGGNSVPATGLRNPYLSELGTNNEVCDIAHDY